MGYRENSMNKQIENKAFSCTYLSHNMVTSRSNDHGHFSDIRPVFQNFYEHGHLTENNDILFTT